MKKVKVWECKIIVPEDAVLPEGFDYPPRMAAIDAVESGGVKVLGCSSGWGGSLKKDEQEGFESQSSQSYPEVYIAGTLDTDDSTPH